MNASTTALFTTVAGRSLTPKAMSPQNGTDWEQDALMQHLLKRKRRLEELEEYNMPEALLKKRRAVKEVAERTPALNISTE